MALTGLADIGTMDTEIQSLAYWTYTQLKSKFEAAALRKRTGASIAASSAALDKKIDSFVFKANISGPQLSRLAGAGLAARRSSLLMNFNPRLPVIFDAKDQLPRTLTKRLLPNLNVANNAIKPIPNTSAYVEQLLSKAILGGDLPIPSGSQTQPLGNSLKLKIDKTKAIRRVGWEVTDWGADKIDCGGTGIDGNKKEIKTVYPFNIGTFERDGQVRNPTSDLTFVSFDLTGPEWPKAFIAVPVLAEKDASGGFLDALRDLWEEIGDDVTKIVTDLVIAGVLTAAGVGAGAAAGAAAGSVWPVVGTIIGAVVGAVIALLVSWLLDSLDDDVLSSNDMAIATLSSPTDGFNGSKRSTPFDMDFVKDSARYRMTCYWEIA